MRSSTSLYGRDFLWIASEMLEILTIIFRIIFNDNPCRPCVPWIKKFCDLPLVNSVTTQQSEMELSPCLRAPEFL